MSELTVVVSRRFSAPAARVFEAWLDPDMLAKFMIPGTNMSVPKATADPRVGGEFEIIMQADDQEIPHRGIYKEISRHSRLVFTWDSPFSIAGSTVTLDFQEVADGTELTLTHVKFPSEESRDNHHAGWGKILETLDLSLSGAGAG
ncbi:SRPBCC domain-containing protein [uncultured Roseibium sp.]|uniref:SRPBCC family protein n=1 Tax=uncultured Roseibium sp. TaxID=1936171 RepID=UPI002601D673|nr:SRPBCC domain-containing protein [uncultured Roseibium sp.]